MNAIRKHSVAYYAALDSFVESRRETPFEWGANDCCTLAADWVAIARGVDPMGDLRGITSAIDAARTIKGEGGLRAAVSKRVGEAIPGGMAQVGDVALVTLAEGRECMAVCVGAMLAAPAVDGLLMIPIDKAAASWRV